MEAMIKKNMRNRERFNIYLFTSGKAISILGSSIYTFAIGLYVLKINGSALNYATTLMLSIIPIVLISPIAGVIADRIPKKWLVVGMDLLSGVLFTVLYFYAISMTLNLVIIYVSTVVLNILTTFFGIGIEAAKPSLVTSERLIKLNSLSKLIDSSASILGTLTVERVMGRIEFRKLLISMNAFIALLAALIGLPTVLNIGNGNNLIFYATMNILMGIAIAYVDVPIMTILQNEIPKKLIGRVLSLIMSLVKVILPVAIISSGLLIDVLPIVIIPIIGASIAFTYSVFLLMKFKKQKNKTLEAQSKIA